MHKTIAASIGFVGCLAMACTTTITARRPLGVSQQSEINTALEGRVADVEHLSELPLAQAGPPETRTVTYPAALRSMAVTQVNVGDVTTRWMEAERRGSVPTAALRQMTFVDHGRGMGEGFGLGLLAGAGTGAVLGAAFGLMPGCIDAGAGPCGSKAYQVLIFGAAGAVAGAIIGMPVGAILGALIGHRTRIDFESGSGAP